MQHAKRRGPYPLWLAAAIVLTGGLLQPAWAGTFTIKKVVVVPAGAVIPASFTLQLTCAAGSTNQTYTVAPGATLSIPGLVVANKVCKLFEPTTPPPVANVPGCGGGSASWEPHLASAASNMGFLSDGQAHLEFTNRLVCDPGRLAVTKFVFNNLGAQVPPSFAMSVTCTSPANPATMTISVGANAVAQTPPIASGSLCSVVEPPQPSVGHVPGCGGGSASWTTTYSTTTAVPIYSGQTAAISVSNQLDCDAKPTGGHLTLRKVVVNTLGAAGPPTFPITAHCGMLNQTVNVPANGGVSLSTVIPAGRVCSVTEPQPASIANVRACRGANASWSVVYSAPVTMTGGGNPTLTVTNTLTCDKVSDGDSTGEILVRKSMINGTGGPLPAVGPFLMTVDCTPSGFQQPISVPAGGGTTVSGVPAPSSCSVSEPLPSPLQRVEGCRGGSASWTTLISPAQPMPVVAGHIATVQVRNTLTCDKPDGPIAPGPYGDPRRGRGIDPDPYRRDPNILKEHPERADWPAPYSKGGDYREEGDAKADERTPNPRGRP